MSNYRRLISYIYAYEGGIKGKNIGFAKIETRGIQCKITVSVKRIYVGGNDIGVYLLAGEREVFLGNIFIRNGSGEFRNVVSVNNIENSGINMEQCYGLTVHDVKNTWRSYTTIWEDAVAHAAEMDLENTKSASHKTDEDSVTEEQIKKAVREIEEEFPITPQKTTDEKQESLLNKEEDKTEYAQIKVEQSEADTVQAEFVHTETREPHPEKKANVIEKSQLVSQLKKAVKNEPISGIKMAIEKASVPVAKMREEKEPVSERNMTVEKESVSGIKMAIKKEPISEIKMAAEKEPAKEAVFASKKPNQQEMEQTAQCQNEQQEVVREKGNVYCEPYGPYNVQATMEYPTINKKESDFMPQLEDPKKLEQLLQNEVGQDSPHDLVWEKFKREHTRILAFDYENGCEILTIKPQDIGLLPRDVWVFGNNSFLLHGYYNYRYLILAKLINPEGMPRYLLGIPGHYYNNERYMASMFGFPHFVLSKEQPRGDDRFGYWYTDIQLGG